MKRYRTNSDVASAWASRRRPDGRSSSMSFRGPVLYSYNTPIAAHAADVVLATSRKYSKTTSGNHLPCVFAVVPSGVLTVPNVLPESAADHCENLNHLLGQYQEFLARQMKRSPQVSLGVVCAMGMELGLYAARVSRYARLFGLQGPALCPDTDREAIEALWASNAAAEKAREAKRAARALRRGQNELARMVDMIQAYKDAARSKDTARS